MKAKAELIAAMITATAECDKAIASLTDATAVQLAVAGRGGQRSRLGTLYGMVTHDNEKYGRRRLTSGVSVAPVLLFSPGLPRRQSPACPACSAPPCG
jgi:hypothetical protein